jgi:hypothetical protein
MVSLHLGVCVEDHCQQQGRGEEQYPEGNKLSHHSQSHDGNQGSDNEPNHHLLHRTVGAPS